MVMVTKAIVPVAGIGSRFLPASRSVPKEMLPILEKPALQYAIEEGVRSGIKNFVMVTGKNRELIQSHFDPINERDFMAMPQTSQHALSSLHKSVYAADFSYVPQHEPAGLGHAVWSARHAIGKEHCAIMLPDDIIHGPVPGIAQLIKIAQQEKCNIVAVQEVPGKDISRYGVVAIKKQFSPNLFQVKELVEKPSSSQAPSNLAIVGRYVLSPSIFDSLEELNAQSTGEIQLTDGIQNLLFSGEKVFAYKIQGTRYDIGNPLGYLKANLAFALKSAQYQEEMTQYLAELDRDMLIMQGKAESLGKHMSL
ncbi:MAG: UTP--glucose-phosphate uridylyltransferase [Candidatus Dependentiae bacterium]|nr:UTP--glucose-phosphate uridylyltransferase [Candidatus Dependentiae bacterium]